MSHAKRAAKFVGDETRVAWHDKALWAIRQKRDGPVKTIPEWEYLRDAASKIKDNVLSHLDEYLLEFEKNASAKGIKVLWAKNADEHNEHILQILQKHGAKHIVKSKSILTEECHLNKYLEKRGFDVVDTDLGERIIQLIKQPPSHIVLPAIHLKRGEVGEIFHEKMGTKKGADDPQYLVEAARNDLREKFLSADVAITGVNFGVAETGSIVVSTNEGNADMGVHLAKVHIASMGIEKIIPKTEHLGIFTRLLARSATGQHITAYTSHFNKPRTGCSMYVILVDNGRTMQLSRSDFRNSLKCIRCGACMNTCPVYRRSGGYSYNFTVPGPIGSILAPNVDMSRHSTLPFASTLCGSCTDVCPVKIDIHEQLFKWRGLITKGSKMPGAKEWMLKFTGFIFSNPWLFRTAGKLGRWCLRKLPRALLYNSLNPWGKSRELPDAPVESFREWYRQNKDKDHYGV